METTAKQGGAEKGKKQQITVSIDTELLHKLDAFSAKHGPSRSSVICMAICQVIEQGLILKA